jgi:hypothetical protein
MKLAEEPFLTRRSVMAVLRPSDLPDNDAPFRTLRNHAAVSSGLKVHVRAAGGHLSGQLRLYNSLNTDAARASRLHQPKVAQQLAAVAERLERTSAARKIVEAISLLSTALPADPSSNDAPPGLRRYARLRGGSSWANLEHGLLTREWLSQSRAWFELAGSDCGPLADAVEALASESEKARSKILGDQRSVSTFYGIVRRLDVSAAQLESDDAEAVVLPRAELERQGLAIVGQAVSLLTEVLPGGGSYVLPMPAVMLERPSPEKAESPWELMEPDHLAWKASDLDGRDSDWIERELARDPRIIPVTPLPIA